MRATSSVTFQESLYGRKCTKMKNFAAKICLWLFNIQNQYSWSTELKFRVETQKYLETADVFLGLFAVKVARLVSSCFGSFQFHGETLTLMR